MMRNLDASLKDATEQAVLAYRFAPGSYTFAVMASVMNAVEARRAPDWIEELLDWNENGTGDVNANPVGRQHPSEGLKASAPPPAPAAPLPPELPAPAPNVVPLKQLRLEFS